MKFKRSGWGGVSVGVGVECEWEAEGTLNHPQGGKQQCCIFSRAHAETATVNLVERDGRQ